ncbi:MAG TPA: exopolyphosphatase, partial [Ruminococcaceae bacterium]|nr:exopolyphosphatase [Oscillospiraceae bacterium]
GLTLREKEPGRYKLSARTHAPVDAGALCALFGGGGHARAAGCEIAGTPEEVTEKVLSAAKNALRDLG